MPNNEDLTQVDELARKIFRLVATHNDRGGRVAAVKLKITLGTGGVRTYEETGDSIKLSGFRTDEKDGGVPELAKPPPDATPLPWLPTDRQKKLLEALKGKSLRTDDLAAAVGVSNSQLFRETCLNGLRDRGLVSNHKSMGFYSVEHPPPGLSHGDDCD